MEDEDYTTAEYQQDLDTGIKEANLEMLEGDYPREEEKQNIFSYFKRVTEADDNRKTANLDKDELGLVKYPVRTNLDIANYCKKIGMDAYANYFESKAQIVSATSLSKEGFLNKLAVTQKRESSIRRRSGISNAQRTGFFGKKPENTREEEF